MEKAWGIFLSHYLENSTFPGATDLEYAFIGGLSVSLSLVSSPMVAASVRHFGTNITLAIGSGLVFAGLFGASYATRIWQLFLSQSLCFGFGMGFLYIPAAAVLPQWFSTRRSLAVGIATSGAGLGGVAYSLIAGAAMRSLGINWTYRVLALCTLGVNGISSLLLRDRNKIVKPKQGSFDYRELGHIEVLLVIIWGFLSELGYVILLYSLPNYAITIGLTQSQGAVVSALLSVGLGIGRPLVGYISDRLGRINMAAIMTVSCGIFSLCIWIPARSYTVLLIFALFAGFGCGTFWGTVSSVTTEVVGLQRLPTAFGVICLALVAPATFAEPIGLGLVSASGYRSAQVFVGFMFILSASSAWLLRSWKITEIESKAQAEEDGRGRRDTSRFQAGLTWLAPRRLFRPYRV